MTEEQAMEAARKMTKFIHNKHMENTFIIGFLAGAKWAEKMNNK